MAIDVETEFTRGGRVVVDFLTFCVMSIRLEPLFVYLVRDYRSRPTPGAALALFDCFCARDAPGRLRALPAELLPPVNLKFEREVGRFGDRSEVVPGATADEASVGRVFPPRYLFDFLTEGMSAQGRDPVQEVGDSFDPSLTPAQNLPGGRLAPGQRLFVERIWQPKMRPRLVASGFWRIANVG